MQHQYSFTMMMVGGGGHVLLKCWFGTSLNYMVLHSTRYLYSDNCTNCTTEESMFHSQQGYDTFVFSVCLHDMALNHAHKQLC